VSARRARRGSGASRPIAPRTGYEARCRSLSPSRAFSSSGYSRYRDGRQAASRRPRTTLFVVNLKPYRLTFVREHALGAGRFPRYAREHGTLRQAQVAARKVAAELAARGVDARLHAAVIHGPRGQIFTV